MMKKATEPTMIESTNNRLQVLAALGGLGLGLITIYIPTWLLLRHIPELNRNDFLDAHPEKRLALTLYEIVAFLNLLTAPIFSLVLLTKITPWMQPFMFFCYWSNSIGIVNAAFECITGICPKRGINLRLSHKQNYICHPKVRKTGLLRLALGLFFVSTVCKSLP